CLPEGQDGEHRGLTPGFLEGPQHQHLVRGRAPRHRGVYAGRVVEVVGAVRPARVVGGRGKGRGAGAGGEGWRPGVRVLLELACPLKLGDGLVFDEGDPQQEEQGGSVFDLLDASGHKSLGAAGEADARSSGKSLPRVTVEFRAGQLDAGRLQPGQLVWKTKDHALEARLRASYEGLAGSVMRSLPVSARVSGKIGSALNLTLRDDAGFGGLRIDERGPECGKQAAADG
ncbi:hypothetical protein QJQ45_026959, partial [Haematococcus lacustris]